MNPDPEASPRAASALYLAWLVAIIATAGSLYFSEIRQFLPCTLCWYQRILMYPLALVLAVGSWRGDIGAVRYAAPFVMIGLAVSAYHVGVQKIDGFGFPGVCRGGVPCDVAYIEWFGFVTIPVLSLTAFVLIAVALGIAATTRR